jgi:hypothetical protein
MPNPEDRDQPNTAINAKREREREREREPMISTSQDEVKIAMRAGQEKMEAG